MAPSPVPTPVRILAILTALLLGAGGVVLGGALESAVDTGPTASASEADDPRLGVDPVASIGGEGIAATEGESEDDREEGPADPRDAGPSGPLTPRIETTGVAGDDGHARWYRSEGLGARAPPSRA